MMKRITIKNGVVADLAINNDGYLIVNISGEESVVPVDNYPLSWLPALVAKNAFEGLGREDTLRCIYAIASEALRLERMWNAMERIAQGNGDSRIIRHKGRIIIEGERR
jgi:hypothetical protein